MSVIVNLQPAIGSGKYVTIINETGGIIIVTADTTGTPDLIDNLATYDLSGGKNINVLDYKPNNWIII